MKLAVASTRSLLRAFVSVSRLPFAGILRFRRTLGPSRHTLRQCMLPPNISLTFYKRYYSYSHYHWREKEQVPNHQISMISPELKPEVVLSERNQKACIETLRSYRLPKERGKHIPEAAVLVPLCLHKGELGLLYTLRSMKLTVNRGQVCFPGGKRDKEDADLTETALRETWEELKIPREKINIWTAMCFIGKGDVNVMPVLSYIGEVVPEKLEINRDEVEEAFVVSLRNLCDPEQCRYTRFSNNFTLPTYLGGKYRVWGFTGAITHLILNALIPQFYKNNIPYKPLRQNNIPVGNEADRESVEGDASRSKL